MPSTRAARHRPVHPGEILREEFLVRGSHDLRARAVIFVTHDRVFLENCATRIIELSRAYPEGTLSVDGNYSEFRRRKGEFLERMRTFSSGHGEGLERTALFGDQLFAEVVQGAAAEHLQHDLDR